MVSSATASSNEQLISQKVLTFMKKYNIQGAAVLIMNQGKSKIYLFGEAVPAKHAPVTEDTTLFIFRIDIRY